MTNDTGPGPQDEVVSIDDHADSQTRRDRDGLASLRDTEAESGDEDELTDTFDLDQREARELGVRLDSVGDDEPTLD